MRSSRQGRSNDLCGSDVKVLEAANKFCKLATDLVIGVYLPNNYNELEHIPMLGDLKPVIAVVDGQNVKSQVGLMN